MKKGTGLFFSRSTVARQGVNVVCAPQVAVQKHDALGRVRDGAWRVCSNHSAAGCVNWTTSRFHHPRPYLPTGEQISRAALRAAFLFPLCRVLGVKHDVAGA